MSNKRVSLSPIDALKQLKSICESNYLKGKRKLNINVVWEIVEAGLTQVNDTDTHTVPKKVVYSNYGGPVTDTTTTKFPNSSGGVIG